MTEGHLRVTAKKSKGDGRKCPICGQEDVDAETISALGECAKCDHARGEADADERINS